MRLSHFPPHVPSPPGFPPSPVDLLTVPTQLNFFTKPGTEPPTKTLLIGVTNRVSVAWSVRAGEPWLSITPTRGETPRNFTGALATSGTVVSADASKLSPGTYSTNISIEVDGQTARVVPVSLYVTFAEPGQNIDAQVKAGYGNAWNAGIDLDGPVRVTVGTWEPALSNPGPAGIGPEYQNGDLLVLVEGELANVSDNDCSVEYWAYGFDSRQEQVSGSLDPGNPLGHVVQTITSHTRKPFTLHLSWAEGITLIVIGATRYDTVTPLPY